MVDALLSAAAESDSGFDDIMLPGGRINDVFFSSPNDHHHIITQSHHHHHAPIRFCEFCNSSNTPTWRRGPAGKGSLCNACGIKWRLRKRLKKSPSPPPPTVPDKKVTPFVAVKTHHKKRKNPDLTHHHTKSPPTTNSHSKYRDDDDDDGLDYLPPSSSSSTSKRKKYYCKYCDQTFSLSQFRNSQQFGAHCSNCSRRPRDEDGGLYEYGNSTRSMYDRYVSPYSPPDRAGGVSPPSTPESPNNNINHNIRNNHNNNKNSHNNNNNNNSNNNNTNNNNNRDGLLLRLLHVVEHQLVDFHELAEIRDELTTFKSELLTREEARRSELGVIRARVKEELADLKSDLTRSIATHEQLAAHRLMEMEQTIRVRTNTTAGLLC